MMVMVMMGMRIEWYSTGIYSQSFPSSTWYSSCICTSGLARGLP
jgi:hypothetical protein